ncbi:MAG: ABC transporter substrate-binding protein [Chloroflexi bacterium]|nr:ABC transporter substrate-binding protein [Chloroflexota bacterium]
MRLKIGFLLLCIVLVSGCVPLSQWPGESGPRAIAIAMGFIPNVQFTPMYVAIERGYFREEGLEVTLDYGMETDLLQRVGANDLQFVVASGDQVVLARANDLPVTYFLNWYRRFPVCVVSLAEKGIGQPQDLVGKTVGTPALAGASYIGWLAFLDEVGISPDSMELQVIGYTQVASLIEGRVDAAICYALNEPVQLREAGYEINVFYLDQYTQLMSNGLITNDETIKREPELVRSVARAFLRGLADTLHDPDAAFEVARKVIPEMDDATARLQRAVLQECLSFWRGDPLGASPSAGWEESVSFLRGLGLVTAAVEPESMYTNAFVE